MININIPNNNINERKYVIDVMLGEFLGLKYKIEIGSKNYEFTLDNSNRLIIEDHFFNKLPKDLEYLKLDNIPQKVELIENEFIVEDNMPVIYGSSKLNIENSKLVSCGIDIFASSFFMLTRWEEYVNKSRDNHNRFPANESLAFKQNFLDRPIVNEYVEMLWNMLEYLGVNQKRKKRNYQLCLTHDVDAPLKYPNWKNGIKEIAGDLIKRKNIKLAFNNLSSNIKFQLGFLKDPFDTFDYLMDVSERNKVKSHFFFMGYGLTKYDNMYKSSDGFIINLINKIKKRGHYIGIHPTYDAYQNKIQFGKELDELENNFNTKITCGREHFLRFEVPTTWQTWEDHGMAWDSTLSYADKEGFRAGVCYEYSVFNILTRQKLNLMEKPLIAMEGSFETYQSDIKPEDMERKIKFLIEKVKKYNGEFVFLWHNSSFNTYRWEKYKHIYERVLNK